MVNIKKELENIAVITLAEVVLIYFIAASYMYLYDIEVCDIMDYVLECFTSTDILTSTETNLTDASKHINPRTDSELINVLVSMPIVIAGCTCNELALAICGCYLIFVLFIFFVYCFLVMLYMFLYCFLSILCWFLIMLEIVFGIVIIFSCCIFVLTGIVYVLVKTINHNYVDTRFSPKCAPQASTFHKENLLMQSTEIF